MRANRQGLRKMFMNGRIIPAATGHIARLANTDAAEGAPRIGFSRSKNRTTEL
jgi:hypothetical protein